MTTVREKGFSQQRLRRQWRRPQHKEHGNPNNDANVVLNINDVTQTDRPLKGAQDGDDDDENALLPSIQCFY